MLDRLHDWYVPRNAPRNSRWVLDSDLEEQFLHRHVGTLYRLGIPTFLREYSAKLMKLSVEATAYVPEANLPEEGPLRNQSWAALKDQFSRLIVSSLAQVVLQMFSTSAKSNLVAVFDASGFSAVDGRWKLSMRLCFVEIAVNVETARKVRDLLISRLGETGGTSESWVSALLPPTSDGGRDPPPGGHVPSFWESIIEERPFLKNAQHRLVWCDAVLGDLELLEERPLIPYTLLNVTAEADSQPSLESVQDELSDGDWVRLGSSWTAATQATDWWSVSCPRFRSARAVAPAPSLAPATAYANISLASDWVEHRTEEGRLYFYNRITLQSRWDDPREQLAAPAPVVAEINHTVGQWKEYRDSEGRPYYHDEVSGVTQWDRPTG